MPMIIVIKFQKILSTRT